MKISKIDVTGLSIDNILNMNVTNLDDKALRQVTTRLISAANKRLKRMIESGDMSPIAQKQLERGKFSIANTKDVKEVYKQVKNYLQSPSSNLRGWKTQKRRLVKALESKGIKTNKQTDWGKAFALYDKLEELYPALAEYKYKLVESIEEHQRGGLDDVDIIELMIKDLNKAYEEQQDDTDDIYQFFE